MKGKIKYGGDLQVGDFLIISENRLLSFGWYVGSGTNTEQYISFNHPVSVKQQFANYTVKPNKYWGQRFKKGFRFESLYKSFAHDNHPNRICKYPGNPEELFTNKLDLDNYRASKKILESFKFPAQ